MTFTRMTKEDFDRQAAIETRPAPKCPKNPILIITYKAKDGFRWHAQRSGNVLADSGQAYKTPFACLRSVEALLQGIWAGKVKLMVQGPFGKKGGKK